jgi:streptomycin 6-kinase
MGTIAIMNSDHLEKRVEERIRAWDVVVQDTLETPSSFLVFGERRGQPVVLKVVRRPGDEWRCGEVMAAFGGRGMARVYEYIDGAALMERVRPGTLLATLPLNGVDEEATAILADVIRRMATPHDHFDVRLSSFVTAQAWGEGFRKYLASGDRQIPAPLVEHGQRTYLDLCASQRGLRLLHGDLQHYNILFDSRLGWLAIDPKGVIGELEYEVGASLRNPYERPELFTSSKVIERRLRQFETELKLDADRALAWGFAQAVLSAIWSIEDGSPVSAESPIFKLANAILRLLK